MIVPSKTCVAVVDDDVSVREAVSGILSAYGFDVRAFDGGASFLASSAAAEAACAVIDVQMPGLGGLDLQRRLAQTRPGLPLIFMTALKKETVRAQAMAGGALGYLIKPVDSAELVRLVRSACGPGDA